MGRNVVIERGSHRHGKAMFVGFAMFFVVLIAFVWVVQMQTFLKAESFGGFSAEWDALAQDFEKGKELSRDIEAGLTNDFLQLDLLPNFALTNSGMEETIASSIEAEMTKRRYGQLPISNERLIEALEVIEPTEPAL